MTSGYDVWLEERNERERARVKDIYTHPDATTPVSPDFDWAEAMEKEMNKHGDYNDETKEGFGDTQYNQSISNEHRPNKLCTIETCH